MSEHSSEITEYTREIEDLFINFMVSKPDLFVRCKGIIKSGYFDDRKNKDAISFIESYSTDFSKIPALEQIKAVSGKDVTIMQMEAELHENWFLREFERFCRHKALREAILSSPDLLNEGRYGEVESAVKNAVLIPIFFA